MNRHTSHGVFILVNEVLADILHHQLVSLLGHPGVDERRKVQQGSAVKRELVMKELVRRLRICALRTAVLVEVRRF